MEQSEAKTILRVRGFQAPVRKNWPVHKMCRKSNKTRSNLVDPAVTLHVRQRLESIALQATVYVYPWPDHP